MASMARCDDDRRRHPQRMPSLRPSLCPRPFHRRAAVCEYEPRFAAGLFLGWSVEELLNSLSRITQLQVAARTSSFSFKGKQVDIADIAHKLNVGAILEGSVRKDGAHVRITAQLINAVTGFHLWSQTYDRNLRDTSRCRPRSPVRHHCTASDTAG